MSGEAISASKPLYTVESLRALVPSLELLSEPEQVVALLNSTSAMDHGEWLLTARDRLRRGSWLSSRVHSLPPEEQEFLALMKESFRFSYGIHVFVYFLDLRRHDPRGFRYAMGLILAAWNRYEGGAMYSHITLEIVRALHGKYPLTDEWKTSQTALPVDGESLPSADLLGEPLWQDLPSKREWLVTLLYNMRTLELADYLNYLGAAMRDEGESEVFFILGDLAFDASMVEPVVVPPLLEPGVQWDLPHLLTFVFLVEEYNLEWAFSVMEWDLVEMGS